MNYASIHEVRTEAMNLRGIYGHRYDMGQIDRQTFENVLEITGEMKNNPHKFTK